MKNMTILQVMTDEALLGKHFRRNWRGKDTWRAWKSFLAALFGLPLDGAALQTFHEQTGRSDAPSEAFTEAWAICGRRSGKSRIAAAVGTYLAAFRDYEQFRVPGETLWLPIIAPDRRQCRVILNYVAGFFASSPMLAGMVKRRLAEAIELTNGVRIEVATASFKTTRGYTAIGGIIDEAAFLRSDDSASPDTELLSALRPSMATIPGALLLCISSPHARRGELWTAFREHYGKNDSPVMIWRAGSLSMNPTLNPLIVQAALLRDRSAAGAEYLAEFRSDVESFLDAALVDSCTSDRAEIPPADGVRYHAFVDPSGGASDSMTLAIAHFQDGKAVLDLVRERIPPFSPEQTVAEFCDELRRYRVRETTGDAYAGLWPREQFVKRSVAYHVSELTRSQLYLELLPALTSGQCQLLAHPKLKVQLVSLERRTSASGKDTVDHRPGAHDDISNAVAGAIVHVLHANASAAELGLVSWLRELAAKGEAFFEKMFPPETVPNPRAELVGKKEQLALEAKIRGIQPVQPNAYTEEQPPCPRCNFTCTSRLYVGWRCNQCGEQFGGEPYIERPPTRASLFGRHGGFTC